MTFEDIQMPHERLREGHSSVLSGEDKHSESSQMFQNELKMTQKNLQRKEDSCLLFRSFLAYKKKKPTLIKQQCKCGANIAAAGGNTRNLLHHLSRKHVWKIKTN